MAINGIGGPAIAATVAGAVLLWSGVKGKSWTKVGRDILSGKDPSTGPADYPIGTPTGSGGTTPAGDGTTPSSSAQGGTVAENQAIAKGLAAHYGWDSGVEWDDLVKLWMQESSWNNKAVNKSSGATGIPQALPASKMPKEAQAPTYSAGPQISWGLSYIKNRYGSPSKAWAHEQSAGWY